MIWVGQSHHLHLTKKEAGSEPFTEALRALPFMSHLLGLASGPLCKPIEEYWNYDLLE